MKPREQSPSWGTRGVRWGMIRPAFGVRRLLLKEKSETGVCTRGGIIHHHVVELVSAGGRTHCHAVSGSMNGLKALDDDRALAKVGHHWLGLEDDNSGTLGSEGCGELLGEPFCGVCMHCSASESGRDGDNMEARQVHAGDAGGLLQQSERLEDGVFLIAHHDEHDRQIMLGGRPYRLH